MGPCNCEQDCKITIFHDSDVFYSCNSCFIRVIISPSCILTVITIKMSRDDYITYYCVHA